ncbi:MAG: hypothetical protein IIZ39_10425, partial [Blautia sp.]|nr:hypothetical protein [Blautia sp.]
TFSLRSDAHTVVEEMSATLPDTHFFSGEGRRSSDKAPVFNRFDDAARGEYLSRQDGFANYGSAMASVKNVVEDTTYVDTDNQYDPALDEGIPSLVKGKDYDAKGSLTLADLKGAAYDDPRWEELISQLSVKELMTFTAETMYTSSALDSVKKPFTFDADGPLGLSSMFKKDLVSVAFPCVPLLAASMNTELASAMGSFVAELMELNHITSWYAPAMDIHRSPLSGRNYEYYSEDATVSAMVAAAETRAAVEKGAIVFIKHFALNDMESQRAFVHTYANEQVIRENCLRPFEVAVKEGRANGVMSSMNFIGDTYAGAHMGLLTDVLRGEWGFVGTVLTDMDEGHQIHNFWMSLRSGVDYWLGYSGYVNKPRSDADIYYLQRAAKNHLWTLAGSNYQEAVLTNWRGCVDIIYIELGLVVLAALIGIVIRHTGKRNRK